GGTAADDAGAGEEFGDALAFLRSGVAHRQAAIKASNRRASAGSAPYSGCHCTPMQKRAAGSSIRSTIEPRSGPAHAPVSAIRAGRASSPPRTPVAAATVPGPAGYGPTAIASDPAGNIWVSDYQGSGQSGTVTEIPAAGGAAVNISVPVYPGVIASDPGGNIWVSGLTYPNYASELTEISASGGAQVNVTGGGLDGPNAIVSAPNGNIWVVDGGSAAAAGNSLTKIPVSKGTPGAPVSMLIPGMYNPRGLALDTDGNFWVLSDTQAQNIGGIKNNSVFVVMGGVAP
nr:hypothetical protein [Nitrospiraceae bacterium]